MPSVTGFVQRVIMDSSGTQTNTACVFVGPSPANTEFLLLKRSINDSATVAAAKSSMLDALTQALGNRREVVVGFIVNDGIVSVDMRG